MSEAESNKGQAPNSAEPVPENLSGAEPGVLDRVLAKRTEITILGLSIVMILILLVLALSYISGLYTFSQTSKYYEEDWHELLKHLWIIVGICSITIIILMRKDGFIATIAVLVIGTLVADNEWILESIAIARGENLEAIRQSRRLTEESSYEDNVARLSVDILESLRKNATLSDKLDPVIFKSVIEKVLNQSEARWHKEVIEREGLRQLFMAVANRGSVTYREYLNEHQSDPRFLEDMGFMRDLGLVSFNWNYIQNANLTPRGRRLMVLMDTITRFPSEIAIVNLDESLPNNFVLESNYGNWAWIDLREQEKESNYLFTASSVDADPRITVYKPAESLIESLEENSEGIQLTMPSRRLKFIAGNDDGGSGLDAELALKLEPGMYLARVESLNARLGSFNLLATPQYDTLLKVGRDLVVELNSQNGFRRRFSVNLPPGVHTISTLSPGESNVDTHLAAYLDPEYLDIYDYNDDSYDSWDAELIIQTCYEQQDREFYFLLEDLEALGGEITVRLNSAESHQSPDDCYSDYLEDESWGYDYYNDIDEHIALGGTLPLEIGGSILSAASFTVEDDGVYQFDIEPSAGANGEFYSSIVDLYSEEYLFEFYTQPDQGRTQIRIPLAAGEYGIYFEGYRDPPVVNQVSFSESKIDTKWSLETEQNIQKELFLSAELSSVAFIELEVEQAGVYQISTLDSSTYGVDPYISLYEQPSYLSGLVGGDDDSAGNFHATFSAELSPGVYYLMVEDYSELDAEIHVDITRLE